MAGQQAQLGTVTLVYGPESFLAQRTVARVVADLKAQDPSIAPASVPAEELTLGRLQEMTGADLFSTGAIGVITDIEKLPKDLEAPLLALAAALPPTSALVCHHGGGAGGKSLLEALKKRAALAVECQTLKGRAWTDFVRAEAAGLGGRIDQSAAQVLVDSVGQDTRALAAAVSQLLADSESGQIDGSAVKRYFAGRATVTGFAVADAALAGRAGDAIEKARWALSTGISHPQITSALANALRQAGKYLTAARTLRGPQLAAAVGAPDWKLRQLGEQVRGWTEPQLGLAIRAVAQADADVKGAAGDPDFALEQAILAVARLRNA
jgi:DNA polymerase-3 subunit delta